MRRVDSCWAIGRSSAEATKASLILCARAVRRRRSAGLTYFLRPRGVVADLREAADVFFDETECFFPVAECVVVAEGFLSDECAGLFALCEAEVAAVEDPELCWSYRFPSTGATASKAQSAAASTQTGLRVGRGERIGSIDSM